MLERIHKWFIGRRFKITFFFIGMTLAYIGAGLVVSLFTINYLNDMQNEVISEHTDKAVNLIVDKSGEQLETLAARMMKEKARDVAKQASLLVNGRSAAELLKDESFHTLVVQRFLNTGYTAVFECGSMITVAHVQRDLEGIPAFKFAKEYPSWWKIFKKGIDCEEFHGKYKWGKTDGVKRDKYMVISPIPGSKLMVAATIYLDEFNSSKSEIRKIGDTERASLLGALAQEANSFVQKTKGLFLFMLLALVAVSLIMSTTICKYLDRIREFAKALASRKYAHTIDGSTKIEEFHQIQSDLDTMRSRFIEFQEESCKQASAVAHSNLARQVAHDLKSPIESLNNVLEDLKKNDRQKALGISSSVRLLEGTSSNLSEMVESILSPKNNYLGKVQKFDLVALIDDLVDFGKKKIEGIRKEISITGNYNLEKLEMVGSVQNIRRVFDNLIENAIEAIDSSGSIVVSAWLENNKIKVSVKDTGRGIPTGRENDIFKEGVTIGKQSGTGIGLHVSRMIVSEHGGDISGRNVAGEGTVFEVMFPAMVTAESNGKRKQNIKITKGKEIVAIDDKVRILSKIYTMAATKGIEGSFYTSFEELLETVDWEELRSNCGHIILDNLVAGSDYDAISMGRYCQARLGREFPISIVTSDHKEERLKRYSRESGIPIYPKSFLSEFGFSLS